MAALEEIKKRQKEVESEWNLGTGLSLKEWLIDKLIDAEAKATHHAEIASVCSATAERYGAALGRIETVANSNMGARLAAIRQIVSNARKEAE